MFRCILFHFYIKPQPENNPKNDRYGCILFHFYIKPQQKQSIVMDVGSCILFHFYIKPQQKQSIVMDVGSCILFHFYIKPQQAGLNPYMMMVVSYSISTSNHNTHKSPTLYGWVVSYSISTSNHNNSTDRRSRRGVVSYSISTSNHNVAQTNKMGILLYLIPFLHQTTTPSAPNKSICGCILFHFYIKPQP